MPESKGFSEQYFWIMVTNVFISFISFSISTFSVANVFIVAHAYGNSITIQWIDDVKHAVYIEFKYRRPNLPIINAFIAHCLRNKIYKYNNKTKMISVFVYLNPLQIDLKQMETDEGDGFSFWSWFWFTFLPMPNSIERYHNK